MQLPIDPLNKRITVRLKKSDYEQLQEMGLETGQTLSELGRCAVESFLRQIDDSHGESMFVVPDGEKLELEHSSI